MKALKAVIIIAPTMKAMKAMLALKAADAAPAALMKAMVAMDATRCGAIPAAKAMEPMFYFDLVLNFFVSYTDQ